MRPRDFVAGADHSASPMGIPRSTLIVRPLTVGSFLPLAVLCVGVLQSVRYEPLHLERRKTKIFGVPSM